VLDVAGRESIGSVPDLSFFDFLLAPVCHILLIELSPLVLARTTRNLSIAHVWSSTEQFLFEPIPLFVDVNDVEREHRDSCIPVRVICIHVSRQGSVDVAKVVGHKLLASFKREEVDDMLVVPKKERALTHLKMLAANALGKAREHLVRAELKHRRRDELQNLLELGQVHDLLGTVTPGPVLYELLEDQLASGGVFLDVLRDAVC